MLLTIHINVNNQADGVATFTIGEDLEISKMRLVRVDLGADLKRLTAYTSFTKQIPSLYAKFTAGLKSNAIITYGNSTDLRTPGFSLGMSDGTSSQILNNLIIDEPTTLSSTFSITLFEIVDTHATTNSITSANIEALFEDGIGTREGAYIDLTFEIELAGQNRMSLND